MAQAFQLQCAMKGGLGRGMACIAAFMLVVMGIEREEDAFWTLVGLVEDRLPHSCVLQVAPFTACPRRTVLDWRPSHRILLHINGPQREGVHGGQEVKEECRRLCGHAFPPASASLQCFYRQTLR